MKTLIAAGSEATLENVLDEQERELVRDIGRR